MLNKEIHKAANLIIEEPLYFAMLPKGVFIN